MNRPILLLTGRLAEKSLRRLVGRIDPEQIALDRFEIRTMPITVAGLMTTDLICRHIGSLKGIGRIIVPGLCIGDLDRASQKLGTALERGPENLKDLPAYLGLAGPEPDLSQYRVKILAEIVDSPFLTPAQALERARSYASDGADVVDIGCLPKTPFPGLEAMIKTLRQNGFKVSVDSMDTDLLARGARAGADYLLSLKESTLWVADQGHAVPVLVPETPGDMASLFRAIDCCLAQKRPFIADPILDPIHFGCVDSIVRYRTLRQKYPDIDIMMGTGNLTELTEADTAGINTLLMGMISELGITHVLTTQVSPHARRCVAEIDLARRIMFRSGKDQALPKGYHSGLTALHSRTPGFQEDQEIQELASDIKDFNFRIQVNETGIHVFNGQGRITTTDPGQVLEEFSCLARDASHAFYMGGELSRAKIAWQLGKPYVQDRDLDWGCAVAVPDPETGFS